MTMEITGIDEVQSTTTIIHSKRVAVRTQTTLPPTDVCSCV